MAGKTDDAKVRAALSEFNKMVPMLTGFARAVTGKKVDVKAAKSTYTDGNTIYIRPPMRLGKALPHDRKVCGMRDENMQQQCIQCSARERVMVFLYHEMAHISFGSFEEQRAESVRRVTIESLSECDDKEFAEYATARVKAATDATAGECIQHYGAVVNPYLNLLMMGLEDFRVDTASFKARPGIRTMRMASQIEVMDKGIERDGDEPLMWYEREPNVQISVALMMALHGHDLDDRFSEPVVMATRDEIIVKNIELLREAHTVLDTYAVCISTLVRLRELGFFVIDNEPQPTDTEDGEQTDSPGPGISIDAPGDGSPGGSEESDTKGEGTDEGDTEGEESDDAAPGDTEGGEATAPGDEEGDEADGADGDEEGDEADGADGDEEGEAQGSEPVSEEQAQEEVDAIKDLFEKLFGHEEARKIEQEDIDERTLEMLDTAIMQAQYFSTTSQEVRKVRFFKPGDEGNGWGSSNDIKISEAVIGKSVLEARRAFTDNQLTRMMRHKKSGRVNGAALGKRAWNNDERLFQKKIVPGKKNYEVLIGLDISGSTANRAGREMTGPAIEQMRRSASALAEVCARSGVQFSIWAHSADYLNEDGSAGWHWDKTVVGSSLDLYTVKSTEQPWDERARSALSRLQPDAGNLDGHTIEFYRKELDKSNATNKILMYFTDGAMPASNYDEELAILKSEIKTFKQKQYTLLGVGIGTDSPKQHGLDTVVVQNDGDIHKVVQHLTKELTA